MFIDMMGLNRRLDSPRTHIDSHQDHYPLAAWHRPFCHDELQKPHPTMMISTINPSIHPMAEPHEGSYMFFFVYRIVVIMLQKAAIESCITINWACLTCRIYCESDLTADVLKKISKPYPLENQSFSCLTGKFESTVCLSEECTVCLKKPMSARHYMQANLRQNLDESIEVS